jgi:hypothetical protein
MPFDEASVRRIVSAIDGACGLGSALPRELNALYGDLSRILHGETTSALAVRDLHLRARKALNELLNEIRDRSSSSGSGPTIRS